jgi:hypothetical protein
MAAREGQPQIGIGSSSALQLSLRTLMYVWLLCTLLALLRPQELDELGLQSSVGVYTNLFKVPPKASLCHAGAPVHGVGPWK